jgi:hypothetical protein
MRASSRNLARILAERIGEVVPSPLTLRAHGSGVSLYAGGELLGGSDAASIVEDDDGRTFGERVTTAVQGVLDGIQDCVMEYLREEWPTDHTGKSASSVVRIEGGRIYPSYRAHEGKSVITLRPIDVDEIHRTRT